MAQNYYSVEKAAQVLGVSADEIRAMLDRRELHGYRDGSSWKFKAEDIDRKAAERNQAPLGDDDIMMDPALLSTGSDVLGTSPAKPLAGDEFDLAMEDDLTLDVGPAKKAPAKKEAGKSDILGDDDMVLGGSGTGSDITIGGNSGINLVSPSDSGLSLESSGGDDSLELGEDDMISLGDDVSEAPTKLRADEEFLLTAAEESGDDDDESGSQVIALDSEPAADQAATMIGTPSTASMVAMLEEDAGAAPVAAAGVGLAAMGMGAMAQPGAIAAAEPMIVESALPETPYSGLLVMGLSACVVFLSLCGMMAFDLVRNMWSWEGTYPVNSAIMDRLLSMIGV